MGSSISDRLANSPGIGCKAPCEVATTANITLSGLQDVDGVTLVAGDRVLVKDQTDGTEDGIYVAGADAWSRASDWNSDTEVFSGVLVPVNMGTSLGVVQMTFTGAFSLGSTEPTATLLLEPTP